MAPQSLDRIPSIEPHPLSNSSSFLSSMIEDPEAFIDLQDKANKRLQTYNPVNQNDNTVVFLQIFLDFLSGPGCIALASDITSLNDVNLRALRVHLIEAILKPMKTICGKTPVAISPHSEEGSQAEAESESTMDKMEASARKDLNALKAKCLERDGDRSALAEESDTLETSTECCHVLPFYLGNFNEDNIGAAENKSIIWNTLYRYFPELRDVISSETINSPENAITFKESIHGLFGGLKFTLEKPGAEGNKYKIVHWLSPRHEALHFHFPASMAIELSCYDRNIPMPSPILLKVHERVSRILNVTGVAKELDSLTSLSQFDHRVAPDGSTDLDAAIRRRLLII